MPRHQHSGGGVGENKEELKGQRVDCGEKCGGWFAKYDPATSSLKIPQLSLFADWNECFAILPRWGMMLDGECFQQPMWEHDMNVIDYGDLRIGTPLKTQRGRSPAYMTGRIPNPYELCPAGFLPNPKWVGLLMGWPDGWTNLQPLVMDKFLLWLHSHGKL